MTNGVESGKKAVVIHFGYKNVLDYPLTTKIMRCYNNKPTLTGPLLHATMAYGKRWCVLARNALHDIKRSLDELIGEKVLLRANGGRRKTIERMGVLEKTYPSVFVVMLDPPDGSFKRVSYSYADVLTETVELMVCKDGDNIRISYTEA